jgi:hypothetical protein
MRSVTTLHYSTTRVQIREPAREGLHIDAIARREKTRLARVRITPGKAEIARNSGDCVRLPGGTCAVRLGPSATCDIFVPSSWGVSSFESVEAEEKR